MMIDTSLDAWAKIMEDLEPRQQMAYDAILAFPDHTAAELTKLLGLKSPIAPRITKLKELGLVTRPGRKICAVTGGSAYMWRIA